MKLVLIEWEDSAQPIPAWSWLSQLETPGAVRCRSVGWLVRETKELKVLAPNMGSFEDDDPQVSGAIQIPSRCVLSVKVLSP